jgi:hypothetical protein
MRKSTVILLGCVATLLFLGSCKGNKIDIPLSGGQTYVIEPSGKAKIYPSGASAPGAQPIHRMQVKIRNEGAGAKTEGCWACTDCICNGDDCKCTECTSC